MNNPETFKQRIKAADPDRFRAAQLADKPARERLLWIYAFHLELAKVPEIVSEPMIGDIRYQWWRDAVDEIYGGGKVRAHEVTTPLADVLRSTDIPRFWVDRLIDGRNRDLDPTPFTDLDAARDYCRQTSGVLMQIAAKCLTDDFDTETVMAMGEAWGLTGLCRAYGYYYGSMLSNVKFEDLLKATKRSYERAHADKIPPVILPACAYVGLVPKYLAKMSQGSFDPKTDHVTLSPFSKQARQLMVTVSGRV